MNRSATSNERNDTTTALWILGSVVVGGGLLWLALRKPSEELPPTSASPSPGPPPAAPAPSLYMGFYHSKAERDQRIADATEAAQNGEWAKLSAALGKLSPEDRAKLQQSLPHF